ncbi:STRAA-like protein [Mya arenaria]|uniref:STRAA-like protein n=1 Tax=Mya arenaria TaxID=6604 RepID=A0ABY7E6H4_MYAAR|nr:STRAA-like protein [Mya arenaria]
MTSFDRCFYLISVPIANCSRSREKVSSPTDSPPYDTETYLKKPTEADATPLGSQHSSRGEFPNIMLEYGNEPLQYDIYTTIGKGLNDAATISVARHVASGHNVAIRQIDLDSPEIDFETLQHEIVVCKQLNHEAILPYYTSFVHNNEVWTVMPLMAYGSCRDLMHAYFNSGLPEQSIAYILRDILSALEYLHGRGIIHRSVKASHILISAAGRVCMSGLRNSCRLIEHGEWNHSIYNLTGYDTKTDIYSLGITACELANGYAPFTDMPPTQMLLEKLNGTKPVLADSTTIGDLTADENVTDPEDSGIDNVSYALQKNSALGYAYSRTFSPTFHHFVELCLERDPQIRPSAATLLTHPFLKNLRKKSTSVLPSLLHPVTPLLDASKLPKDDSAVDVLAEEMEDLHFDEDWDFD